MTTTIKGNENIDVYFCRGKRDGIRLYAMVATKHNLNFDVLFSSMVATLPPHPTEPKKAGLSGGDRWGMLLLGV